MARVSFNQHHGKMCIVKENEATVIRHGKGERSADAERKY